MRRSTVLLVAVALTAFVLTSAFATTVYLRGIMCPPDPANLPPHVLWLTPSFAWLAIRYLATLVIGESFKGHYSPYCLVRGFSEVGVGLSLMASCLWWKRDPL
jgi:hypothetical protein